jgi:hypothetical protein
MRSGTPTPGAGSAPTGLTIDELLLTFLRQAEQHYRRHDGTPTDQVTEYKNALKPVHRLYGHAPAVNFGPLALKTVRQVYIDAGRRSRSDPSL